MFREKWGRRVAVGIVWAVLNYVLVCLQPFMKLDIEVVKFLVKTSGWVAAVIVLGLSTTDTTMSIVQVLKKNGDGAE